LKLLTVLPGLVLVVISVMFIFGFVRALLLDQRLMLQAIVAGAMLAFAWYLYMQLPAFLRRFLTRLLRPSRGEHHDH
jgi:hypothetical protein